jgi:hypothetical protein
MQKLIILTTVYVLILMVLLSLDGTYTLTHTILGRFIGSPSQEKYGTGMKLNSPGFIIHLILFAVFLIIPMMMYNQ